MSGETDAIGHGAILSFWTDIPEAAEADFNDWYENEHLPERLGVPGFQAGMRYIATSGHPRYLAFYEIDDASVMQSAAYLQRLDNPSPWTRRIMRTVTNARRIIYRPRIDAGSGYGSHLLTARFAVKGDSEAFLPAVASSMDEIAAMPEVRRVRLWQSIPALSDIDSEESRIRGDAASQPTWGLVVEATTAAALARLAGRSAAIDVAGRLREAGAIGAITRGRYRFLSMLRTAD